MDEAFRIDMVSLRDRGFFKVSEATPVPLSWTVWGRLVGSALIWRADRYGMPARARLAYVLPHERGDGEPRLMDYEVGLASSQCHFGGHRYWFVCPLARSGLLCGRRCRCLYRSDNGDYFGCRECCRLTYKSRRMHRDWMWEAFLKHDHWLKSVAKYKKPRGPKADQRRFRGYARVGRALARAAGEFRKRPLT